MSRPIKGEYYLGIAKAVAMRSTCLRRRYGAVIVKDDRIVGTGYNGSPKGEANCCDIGMCERERLGVPKGERYELCKAVHAEQNAMIQSNRLDMLDATIFITGMESDGNYADPRPCKLCTKMLKNSGIRSVVGRDKDGEILILDVSSL